MTYLRSIALVVVSSVTVLSYQFITENTIPSDSLTSQCAASLIADIACPRQVGSFTTNSFFPVEALEEACTGTCSSALGQYEADVASACGGEDDIFLISGNRTAPVSFIPTLLRYHFNKTCIQDGIRWCNNVAFESSGETENLQRLLKKQEPLDMCDNCVIKQYQFQAGSPINGGFALQANYSSLTESCSVTDFPLSTFTTPFPEPEITETPGPMCSGTTYTIQPGDTCNSIALSQSVGTAWLLHDNRLPAFCVNFPTEGDLCIQNTCETYIVQTNDTCASISLAQGVSAVQLYTWNPILGANCRSIASLVDTVICLTPPGDDAFPTAITTAPPAPEPTAAPIPEDIAEGTTENCALYYLVEPGEYCNLLVLKFSIVLADFLFLNSAVNENCTNLFAFESYCVAPVGPIDQYPGHPGYLPPPSSVSQVAYDELPKATFVPPTITGLPSVAPLAEGTRKDCFAYANGDDLQFDLSWGGYGSVCEALADAWGIELAQLKNWNPSLPTNSTECAPEAGFRYCLAMYDAASITRPEAAQDTGSSLPIREGATELCLEFWPVVDPDTCQAVLTRFGITIGQFYEWNPSVGDQCQNLWLNYQYCVRVDPVATGPESTDETSPSSTTTSADPTPTIPTPPGPTQPGIAENCNAWHVAESGDGCYSVSQTYGITLQQFYDWNPAIQEDCTIGFWLDYAYCVGLAE